MESDLVVAIATPAGMGGISVVRSTGPGILETLKPLFSDSHFSKLKEDPSKLFLGTIYDSQKKPIDKGLCVYFKSPQSYTGEDTLEFHLHGSLHVQQRLIETCLELGVRMAEPGEFTKRAFINGKLDLTRSEAVIDLIESKTASQSNVAQNILNGKLFTKIKDIEKILMAPLVEIEATLDYPEEMPAIDQKKFETVIDQANTIINELIDSAHNGRMIREGIKIALIGKPNVGKSSLFNWIVDEERSIVTEIAGTTRDVVHEEINFKGMLLRFLDTAGLRKTKERVEALGIEKTKEHIEKSDYVFHMISDLKDMPNKAPNQIVILNKIDEISVTDIQKAKEKEEIILMSVKDKKGLEDLWAKFEKGLNGLSHNEDQSQIYINSRHHQALLHAKNHLKHLSDSLVSKIEHDLLTIDLKNAVGCLRQITGEDLSEETVKQIFERFCVGK